MRKLFEAWAEEKNLSADMIKNDRMAGEHDGAWLGFQAACNMFLPLINELEATLLKVIADIDNPPYEISPWSNDRVAVVLAKIQEFKEQK